MRTLANNEDPDEMQLNAAFHLGLHYLPRLKQSSAYCYYNDNTLTFILELK